MKAIRDFKGHTKGQAFKTEGVSAETIKLMVKRGFIKADEKETAVVEPVKAKSKKGDKND
jgi:hypothetical protein